MKKISIICIILLFVLTGCSKKDIKVKDIFSQKGDEYYVYFYKKDCPACENVKPKVYEYLKKSNERKSNLSKLYQMDVFSLPNLNATEDWKDEILGTRNVLELTIGSVPTLILVKDHRVNKVITGRSSITEELDKYLGN